MGNGEGDSSLDCSTMVVSSLISVTEIAGVVGVDMVVVFVSDSCGFIKIKCFILTDETRYRLSVLYYKGEGGVLISTVPIRH